MSFATALGKEVHQPVAIYMHSNKTVPRLSLNYGSTADLLPAIAKALGVTCREDSEFTFYTQQYPKQLVLANGSGSTVEPEPSGYLNVKSGRVSTSADGTCMFLSDLSSKKFSKPVKLHWFIQKLFVTTYCQSERESVFLKIVAKAVGAEFSETPKEYSLDYSPSEYRERASATFVQVGAKDQFPMKRETLAYSLKALAMLSDDQLRLAFKSIDSSVEIPIIRTDDIYQLAIDRLNRLHKPEVEGNPSARNIELYNWIKDKVDFESPGQLAYYPMCIPQTKLHVKGEPNAWFNY